MESNKYIHFYEMKTNALQSPSEQGAFSEF